MTHDEGSATVNDPAASGMPVSCPACGTAPAGDANEAITHCEWCGAEYPVPDDADTAGPGTG